MKLSRRLGVAAAAVVAAIGFGVRPAQAPALKFITLPTLLVSPSSIDLALHTGEEATAPLFISNTSDGTLGWTVQAANVAPGPSMVGMLVLVERSKGQAALPAALTDALTAAGAVVLQNYAAVTAATLSGFDVLILRDQTSGYTSSEQSAIGNWLFYGGGVYMSAHEALAMSEFNSIASIAFAGFYYGAKSLEPGLTGLVSPHVITRGIDSLQVAAGVARLLPVGYSWAGLLAQYMSGDGLSMYSETFGGGRAVAAADELEAPASLQTPGADNLAFLLQAIAWAGRHEPWLSGIPESGTTPALSTSVVDLVVGPVSQGGTYTADIEVRSPAIGDSVVTIPLSVQVMGDPILTVVPASLDFGETYSSYPKTLPLRVTNPGSAVLVGSAIYATLPTLVPAPTSFAIASGETAWVDVTFTPDADGPISGYVVIEHNAESSPRLVPVTGTGVTSPPPTFSMEPDSLVVELFSGGVADLEVAVANTGGGPLDWSLGSLPAWLAAVPTAGVVAAADTDTFTVTFAAPGPAGLYAADIPVTTNDPFRPEDTLTTIMNVIGAPDIDVPAELVAFPDRFLGGMASLQVLAYNRGVDSLTGTVVTDDTGFAVSPTSVTIQPGSWALYTVAFSPAHSGLHTGLLSFATNDPDEGTLSVPMTGVGVDPAWFSVTPESLVVALPPGIDDAKTLTIHNVGGGGAVLVTVPETEGGGAPPPLNTSPAVSGPFFVFFDDFEDGNFDGWIDAGGGGTKEVTDASGAAGTARSYREADSDGGYHYRGIYHQFDEIQPRAMSFWVRTSIVGTFAAYVSLRDRALRDLVSFYASGTGTFYCNASTGGDYSYVYEIDRWYHIEFRNMDFVTKTFDYVVDGEVVKAGVGLRNASQVNEVSRIDLYNYSLGAWAWWDEIRISYVPRSWLATYPYTVDAAAGADVDFEARFSTMGLSEGTYRGAVYLQGDHPENPFDLLTVPVVLTVDSTATGVDDEEATPRAFALGQNAPNPFNPTTTIAYDLPQAAEVTLAIFDVSGRRVRTLVRGRQPAGRHTALWSGTDDAGRRVASGVYFYRLVAGARSATRKMVMLR